MSVCVYVCMCLCVFKCMCVCVYLCMCVCELAGAVTFDTCPVRGAARSTPTRDQPPPCPRLAHHGGRCDDDGDGGCVVFVILTFVEEEADGFDLRV